MRPGLPDGEVLLSTELIPGRGVGGGILGCAGILTVATGAAVVYVYKYYQGLIVDNNLGNARSCCLVYLMKENCPSH